MMKRWRMLGWPALLAAAIATAPAVGADPDNQPDLKKISESLTEIKNKLTTLDKITSDIAELQLQVQKTQADTNKAREEATKARGDVSELTREVERLRREVNALKDRMSSATQSLYGPTRPAPGVATGMGRIRLKNTFAEPVSIVLNEAAYDLEPGETYVVEAPAGNFTYEVLGIQRPLTRTLAAGETFTINVYTR